MLIGSPGAENVGRPLYFKTLAITAAEAPDPPAVAPELAAAGDEPPPPGEADFPELVEHAASKPAATATTAIPERALRMLVLKIALLSFRWIRLVDALTAFVAVHDRSKIWIRAVRMLEP